MKKDAFCEAVNDVDLKRFLKGEMFGCANNLCSAFRCLASNFLLTRLYVGYLWLQKAFCSRRPLICICVSSFYDRKRQHLYLFSPHCFTT